MQVHVTAAPDNDPGNLVVDKTFNISRYEAVVDPKAPSLNTFFLKTLADGSTTRHKEFDYHLPAGVETTFAGTAAEFDFGGPVQGEGALDWTFTPTAPASYATQVSIMVGSDQRADSLTAGGTGVGATTVGVNLAGLATALNTYLISSPQYFNGTAGVEQASAAFKTARAAAGTDAKFVDDITKGVLTTVQAIYAGIPGISVVANGGPVPITWQVPLGGLSPGQGAVTSDNPTLGGPNPGYQTVIIPSVGLSLGERLVQRCVAPCCQGLCLW